MNVKIKRLSEDAVIPKYEKPGDSGFDLATIKKEWVKAGGQAKIPIGLAFEIPEGYELQIRPRSGITSKTKLRVQLGTIDSGYRGQVFVTVDNIEPIYGDIPILVEIEKGTRIAQGVIAPVIQATFEESETLSDTERGEFGFGSTGVL